MAFPVFKNKSEAISLFHAADLLNYTAGKTGRLKTVPFGVIFCYQNSVHAYVQSHYQTTRLGGIPLEVFLLDDFGDRVAYMHQAGFGAPAAAVSLELLIACGVRNFISIGTAGGLQKDLTLGDIVLCDKAIRDEGTSYHYQSPARFARSDKKLLHALEKQLAIKKNPYITGPGWTTDAVFRESVEEVRQYQQEGILTVDMEASALFTIAGYRKVALAAAFVVSDDLSGLKWKPAFFSNTVREGLHTLFDAAAVVLENAALNGKNG